MVKLLGPLHSMQATGKLGKAIQFSRTKRGTCAGRRRVPNQPRTQAQRAARMYVAFLSQYWSNLSDAERATWLDAAGDEKIAPYHAYIRYNVNRYKNLSGERYGFLDADQCPSTSYPATKDTDAAYPMVTTVVGGSHKFTHTFHIWTPNDNWLFLYHRSVPEKLWPRYDNLIGIFAVEGVGDYVHVVENLPANVQTIRLLTISHTGKSWATTNQFDVTILP